MAMPQLADWLNKPEYWFQPRQLWRKARFAAGHYHNDASVAVNLPWGMAIAVNPHDSIGKSLATCAVYELAVSEVLWRLTDGGDHCIDVGANIGYMTSLLAAAAGPGGQVDSFEPHPLVYQHLAVNCRRWASTDKPLRYAPIELHPCAVGAADCNLDLIEPGEFAINQSGATLIDGNDSINGELVRHRVQVRRLDDLLPQTGPIGIGKIDVEGAELQVLQGAQGLFAERKIRDLVVEDFRPFPSPSISLLNGHGYRVFRIAKSLRGPRLWDPWRPETARRSPPWEPVNYLATLDADRAIEKIQPRGWLCLQRHK